MPAPGVITALTNTNPTPAYRAESPIWFRGEGFNDGAGSWDISRQWANSGGCQVTYQGKLGFMTGISGGHADGPMNCSIFIPYDGSGPVAQTPATVYNPALDYFYNDPSGPVGPYETYLPYPPGNYAEAPKSRHTGGNMVAFTKNDSSQWVAQFGGSLTSEVGGGTNVMRVFDLSMTPAQAAARPDVGWQLRTTTPFNTGGGFQYPGAFHAPSGKIYYHTLSGYHIYDVNLDSWTHFSSTINGTDIQSCAFWDDTYNNFWMVNSKIAIRLRLNPFEEKMFFRASTNFIAPGFEWASYLAPLPNQGPWSDWAPGSVWHPRTQQIGSCYGDNIFHISNPVTNTHRTQTLTGYDMDSLILSRLDVLAVINKMFLLPDGETVALVTSPQDPVYTFLPQWDLASPHLAFTDVAQVKRDGNSDTSHGQVLNQDGGFVTVWGTDLGASQGASTITLGGVVQNRIYYWGNAISPWCPANLYNEYQHYQCIIFQVDHTTPTGAQDIVVTIEGVASNGLSINVTTLGVIRYAGSAPGSWSPLYPSIQAGMNAMGLHDTLYVLDNTFTPGGCTIPGTTNAAFNPSFLPFMIVGYPGALSQVGDATHHAFNCPFALDPTGFGQGVVYAKLQVYGNSANQAITFRENSRVVGNLIQAPLGHSLTGAIWGYGSNISIFGNEFTNCGNPGNLEPGYHTVYSSGYRDIAGSPVLERFREIAYNYFHDNSAARAINCFNTSNGTDPVLNRSNPVTDHVIHDNVIINQEEPGILIGTGMCGKNWIYNNILFQTGLLNLASNTSPSSALELRTEYPRSTPFIAHDSNTVYIFNNTFWRNADSVSSSKCAFFFRSFEAVEYHIHNNIVDQDNGFPYVTFQTGAGEVFPTFVSSKNLWFGAGAAPFFDSSPLAGNPLFVNEGTPKDLHVQQTSPANGTGISLAGDGIGLYDLDGKFRSAWSAGAYEGIGAAPALPPATVSLSWVGMSRDRVRPGILGLTPDGLLDGTMTLTFTSLSGRSVTGIVLTDSGVVGSQWDTDGVGPAGWALGVALTLDDTLLNNPTNAHVNFTPADGSTVVLFGSAEYPGLFTVGSTMTATVIFNDLSTAHATTLVGSAPPPFDGSFTVSVSGNVLADIIGSLIVNR